MCFDYGRFDRKVLYAAYKDWTGMDFALKHKGLSDGVARAVVALARE